MRVRFVHWCIAGAALANIAVFVWQRQEADSSLPHTSDGLRDLVLLSELEKESAPAAPASQGEERLAVTAPLTTGAAGDPAAAEVATAFERPGLEASPAESAEPPKSGTKNGKSNEDAPPERKAPRCWLAGPVADDRTSEALSAQFASASISMDLILRTVEANPDHWVYLPTDGSQAEVRRLSRALREDGMDNFLITNGPLAGSLSLGLFRAGERAKALQGELRDRGYDVDIYLRPRYRDEAWIALDDRAREALGWPAADGVLPGFDRVMLEEQSCERQ